MSFFLDTRLAKPKAEKCQKTRGGVQIHQRWYCREWLTMVHSDIFWLRMKVWRGDAVMRDVLGIFGVTPILSAFHRQLKKTASKCETENAGPSVQCFNELSENRFLTPWGVGLSKNSRPFQNQGSDLSSSSAFGPSFVLLVRHGSDGSDDFRWFRGREERGDLVP